MNAALINDVRAANRQAYAVNNYQQPMADRLTKYMFKRPGEAIYTQSLADAGFTRPMFEALKGDLEFIRLQTKEETDTSAVRDAILCCLPTLGVSLCLLGTGGKKVTTDAVKPAQQYLDALNDQLRARGIAVQWRIEQMPYSDFIEVLAYRTAL